METSLEPAATKRGCGNEAQEAGRKKAAGVVRTRKPDISWVMHDLVDEMRLKRGVARLNKENPNGRQIVLEELTGEERAALLQQEKEWARKMEEVHSVQREADRLAKQAERARAPPPPPEDPSKDKWQLDYEYFRQRLEMKLAGETGFSGFSFEDNTRIPAMCFTENPMRDHTRTRCTLQIFTVKVAGLKEGLRFPFDVFGMVAVRDKLDYSRNIIFSRTRDNSQTLTEQDPCLVLTGPSRAVFYSDKVYVEAVLKVKGATESEDADLSLLFQHFVCCQKMNLCVDVGECRLRSCVSSLLYTSKVSTLEFTCGLVASSVEATIAMQIVEGSWPEGLQCKLTACIGSLGHMDVLLLDSEEEKVPVAAADGTVELSRRVVSVESYGQLVVRGMMRQGDGDHGQVLAEGKASFAPLDAGRSRGVLRLGVCKFEVTVAWSRILFHHLVGGLPLALPVSSVSSS